MQKVYKLLRNNRETGPYTLEELLQMDLQQHDLIWIEGKSSSWAYPYEVDALQSFIAPPAGTPAAPAAKGATPAAATHIFVSLPAKQKEAPAAPAPSADPIAQRAEALRQRVQHAQAATPEVIEAAQTNYARSLHQAEEEYTHWMYEKTTKKGGHTRKYLVAAGLMVVVFSGGLFAGQLLRNGKPQGKSVAQQQATVPKGVETTANGQSTPATAMMVMSTPEVVEEKSVAALNNTAKKDGHIVKTEMSQPLPAEQTPAVAMEATPQTGSVADSGTPQESQPTPDVPVAEKKRGGLFGNLFKKKPKEPEQEGPETAVNEGAQGSRRARRREEGEQTPAVNLADQIELTSTVPQNNWMLGIRGQKVTLYNRSNETIKTAAVEVLYTGEEAGVLDKKTIYFSNVNPKSGATAALPDHRLAEKVSLKLLAAHAASGVVKQ